MLFLFTLELVLDFLLFGSSKAKVLPSVANRETAAFPPVFVFFCWATRTLAFICRISTGS